MLKECYSIEGAVSRAASAVRRNCLLAVAAAFIAAAASSANAQAQAPAATSSTGADTWAATALPKPASTPVPFKDRIGRWVELQTGSISMRYRYVANAGGQTVANQGQYAVAVRAKFKFDPRGKVSVTAGLFSGNSFSGGWNNTGWGTGKAQSHLFLKELFVEAKPVKGVSVQFGGIDIQRGLSTEVTSYDNDGHIMGERLTLQRPKQLYFDTVAVTYGYLGDLNKASVNRRWRRLGKSNYHQFLVVKKLSDHVAFSADYTFESGADTLRQAVKFTLPKGKLIDTFLFENYQPLSRPYGYGFSVYGEKKIGAHLTAGAGFARIDRTMLNGDRYPRGNRFYFHGSYVFAKDFTLSSALIHGVGDLPAVISRTRLDVILTYNFMNTLRRNKVL